MYHMVAVCGVCDMEITAEDYDNRHWSEDGVSEYHAQCCPECPGTHPDLDPEWEDALRKLYGWDDIIEEVMNKEDK